MAKFSSTGYDLHDLTELEYQNDSTAMIKVVDLYINKQYGVRCDEFEPGCVVCRIWKMRDDLKAFVE